MLEMIGVWEFGRQFEPKPATPVRSGYRSRRDSNHAPRYSGGSI
jgi:hypothetical protein